MPARNESYDPNKNKKNTFYNSNESIVTLVSKYHNSQGTKLCVCITRLHNKFQRPIPRLSARVVRKIMVWIDCCNFFHNPESRTAPKNRHAFASTTPRLGQSSIARSAMSRGMSIQNLRPKFQSLVKLERPRRCDGQTTNQPARHRQA